MNVIEVKFGTNRTVETEPRYQHDKGQILHLLDIEDGIEVQFSNKSSDETINKIVSKGQVEIPDFLLSQNEVITAYIQYIDENSQTTFRVAHIPVIARTKSEDGIVDNDKPTFRAEMQGIMNDTKDIAESAKKEAQSVREDADAGLFDGKTPQKGIDYLTDEEINTFKLETKTYINEQITERVDKVKSDYIEELISDYVGGGDND
jgi:hypothetical protein